MKKYIAHFVLVLSLLCNPMAGLIASVPEKLDTAMEHNKVSQTAMVAPHDIDDHQACVMDCCQDGDCIMERSCMSCPNLLFENAMLLETLKFYLPDMTRSLIEPGANHLPDRPIVPELRPPA